MGAKRLRRILWAPLILGGNYSRSDTNGTSGGAAYSGTTSPLRQAIELSLPLGHQPGMDLYLIFHPPTPAGRYAGISGWRWWKSFNGLCDAMIGSTTTSKWYYRNRYC